VVIDGNVTPSCDYLGTLAPTKQEGFAMRVIQPSRDELLQRRVQLLEQLRMTREELEERAEGGLLSPDAYWLWEEIRGVEFLLGEDGYAGGSAAD
jgi:hypothetical protein